MLILNSELKSIKFPGFLWKLMSEYVHYEFKQYNEHISEKLQFP